MFLIVQVLDRAVQNYEERTPQKIARECEVRDSFPLADTLDAFQVRKHDNAITWTCIPQYLTFVRGIHQPPTIPPR